MDQEIEIWKPIFFDKEPTIFEVSSFGRVRSFGRGEIVIRATCDNGHGYESLSLYKRGYGKIQFKVHRLVAIYFLPNPDNLPEVNHKDGEKKNNKMDNLEWASKKENSQHAAEMGLLSRGSRKLPPKSVGKFFAGILLKSYQSAGSVVKDGYPRVSVQRAASSGNNYKGFFWKYI